MNRELVFRIRITRAAARLAVGAALLWLPAGTLTPATHELTLTTVLPAPVGVFTGLKVNGRAIFASNNGANVTISTTSCIPSAGTTQFTLQNAMTSMPQSQCRDNSEGRAGVRILSCQNTNQAGACRNAAPRTDIPQIGEAFNTKLFVRGDVYIDRLIWYWNNAPNGVNSNPDKVYTYWPDEISGFQTTSCNNDSDPNDSTCTNTFSQTASDITLDWVVKNGTGPSPGYYRTYLRRKTNTNLSQAIVVMRSNVRPTTTAPYLPSPNNACQHVEPCFPSVPGRECTTGRYMCVKGCRYTIQNNDFDLGGQCKFKIEQNYTAEFPYMVDVRLMCVKMSQDRWDAECAPVSPVSARHPDCRMRCPANPESMSCPYDPVQDRVERCSW